MPIISTNVPIDADSTGYRWVISDEDELARLVGLVAKCEFGHVEAIISGGSVDPITYSSDQGDKIKQRAIEALTIPIDPATGKEEDSIVKKHRDGFLFEAISWIVARMTSSPDTLLRDPHITSTTQGLDGLMIELSASKDAVIATTVFEDKCTTRAQYTFGYKTLKALKEHHYESRKVLESATTLLRQEFKAGMLNSMAAQAIAISVRKYRSSLTILPAEDTQADRIRIFNGYCSLTGITQADRMGCTLVTSSDIRDWFENFTKKVISTL